MAMTVVSSIVLGLVAGWVAWRLMALVEDVAIELAISLAAAYGVYLLADGDDPGSSPRSSPAW